MKDHDTQRSERAGARFFSLDSCPRCGSRHLRLKLRPLKNPHSVMATAHWAWCPKLRQPVVFIPKDAGNSPAA